MVGRFAAFAVCVALAACAGLEPAGRNASRGPTPQPAPRATPASPPPATAPLPPPSATPSAPPTAAPVRAPAPPASVTPTPAPTTAAAPTPAPVQPPPPLAAPSPSPASTQPAPAARPPVLTPNPSADTVVVPGQRERQVAPPNGDPRSTAERMQDIRAWDQCVTRVQAAYETNPTRPQLESPEEYCGRSLGMADRDALPLSRIERRR